MYNKYLVLFALLDYCFDKSTDLDLPPFLGELSPYIWGGGMPMDREVYNEWEIRSKNLNSYQELLHGVVDMLCFYEKKYHFDFTETKKVLTNITEHQVALIIQGINLPNTEAASPCPPENFDKGEEA